MGRYKSKKYGRDTSWLRGAADVFLTPTSIVVTKITRNDRGQVTSSKSVQYPKTKHNLSDAGKMYGHIRSERDLLSGRKF